jgi:hypothetical protein
MRAAQDIASLHNPVAAGAIIKDRLATIQRRRLNPGPRRSIEFLEDRLEELEAQNTKLRNRGSFPDH